MRRIALRSVTIAAITSSASLLFAGGAMAEIFPRATGISISNVARDGFTVTFDVTMTTTETAWTTSSAWNPGRIGTNTGFRYVTAGYGYVTVAPFNPATFNYVHQSQNSLFAVTLVDRSYHGVYPVPFSSVIIPTSTYAVRSQHFRGAMPAIDFGDGSTIPVATLTTVTGAPGVVRVYRGSFSHTYADHGDYTITVGGPPMHYATSFSPSYGTVVPRSAYPVSWERASYADYFVNGSFQSGYSAYYNNYLLPGATSTVPLAFTTVLSGTVRDGYHYVAGPLSTGNAVAQVIATAEASFSILEVPTASTYGLLGLILVLAAAGVMLLRR